ncbi:hypothetical protein, partial [Marichromatium gracile]|uniref:hypothetical protein n=1 Tax=Marichromatium gracile TaxID=1048 RepID=UPI001A92A4AD
MIQAAFISNAKRMGENPERAFYVECLLQALSCAHKSTCVKAFGWGLVPMQCDVKAQTFPLFQVRHHGE